ncbi:MAG: aldo/keto reductase [Oscillospiraceae bacterium]
MNLTLSRFSSHRLVPGRPHEISEEKPLSCNGTRPGITSLKEMEAVLKAANPEASIASWAFRWVASFPLVKTILSGMSNMEQVADNIKTLSDPKPFTPKEEEALKTVVKMIMEQPTIPCTGCSYCMDCPNGVQIPTVFKIYNDYIREKNLGSTKKKYFQDLAPECRADCCISGAWAPQQISIPTDGAGGFIFPACNQLTRRTILRFLNTAPR